MNNHWHLFLSTPEANLSRGMHDLSSGYATLFNRRYRRSGALFQGRYKGILVQEERYTWTLSRYVHLNPVRAGAVKRPHEYRWSSYRDYVDPRNAPSWLEWEAVLGQIGGDHGQASRDYTRFVESGLGRVALPSPLDGVVAGALLGSQSWIDQMKVRIGALPPQSAVPARRLLAASHAAPSRSGRLRGLVRAAVRFVLPWRQRGNDAMAAVYLARRTALSVTQLARQFGAVSPSAISRLVRRAVLRRQNDHNWDRALDRLASDLCAAVEKSKVKT